MLHRLCELFNPHTVILYGSYAKQEETLESDVDIACFCDEQQKTKHAETIQNIYLDAWVYPTSSMNEIDEPSLRFRNGILLLDQRSIGEQYLEQVQEKYTRGPTYAEPELNHLIIWIEKTIARAEVGDLESGYRRTLLQSELLELYFQLQNKWFTGSKEAFTYLQDNDPIGMSLFEEMYSKPQSLDVVKSVVTHILNRR